MTGTMYSVGKATEPKVLNEDERALKLNSFTCHTLRMKIVVEKKNFRDTFIFYFGFVELGYHALGYNKTFIYHFTISTRKNKFESKVD